MSVLNTKTELLILVIVRWHDYQSRQFLRNTIGTQNRFKSYPNLQLLFVFGIPKSATSEDLESIQEENRLNKDMIITGELQILKLKDCFDLSHCTNFDLFFCYRSGRYLPYSWIEIIISFQMDKQSLKSTQLQIEMDP